MELQKFIRDELLPSWREFSEPDWNGYDAEAVPKAAVFNVVRFMLSLPRGWPMPDVGAEPDGYLTLEWHNSPSSLISVSVGDEPLVHYAMLNSPDKASGKEAIKEKASPELVELIQSIVEERPPVG